MERYTYITFPGLGIDNEIAVGNVAFTVFGKQIMWYGIIITVGIILGYIYAEFRARRNEGFEKDELIDYALAGVIFGIIGARTWYVATFFDMFRGETFLETLRNCVAIWEGGLGFYGGLILGAASVICLALIKKKKVLKVLDPVCLGVMIAQIVGRWGNFINGEAYGSETSLPWRMGIRTAGMTEPIYVHPTFIYESLWNLIGFLIINFTYRKKRYDGQIFLRYLTWYGFGRMFIEQLRTDSLYVGKFRISQLFGFVCFFAGSIILISVDIILYLRKKDNAKLLCSEAKGCDAEISGSNLADNETESVDTEVNTAESAEKENEPEEMAPVGVDISSLHSEKAEDNEENDDL